MKTILLLLAMTASHGVDTYYTDRQVNHSPAHWRGYEDNPLQRPFVHGTAWCYSAQSLQLMGTVAALHVLHKHHARLADSIALADIGTHTFGAVKSATDFRNPEAK